MFTLTVGQEVVVFYCGSPLAHAGKVKHECRGTVTKVGRKLAHVSSLGADVKVPLDGTGLFTIHTVNEAKRLYAATFGGPKEYRTPAQIAAYVASL